MNESFYFPHDYNARSDPKLQQVLMDVGIEGIGIYWCLIEMLYEQGGILPISSCKSIAFALHVHCNCIQSIINDFGLFNSDSEFFWSESVKKRLKKRCDISNKRKEAAISRWKSDDVMRKSDDVMQKQCNCIDFECKSNAIKEKERKGNNKETIPKGIVKKDELSFPSKKDIEVQKSNLYSDLVPFVSIYGQTMVREFYDYWTEPNKSNTKVRWMLERTWDTKRRLSTWAKNESKYARNNQNHRSESERAEGAKRVFAKLLEENKSVE